MYSLEQLMYPVWDTDVIYDEALTMIRSDGAAKAPLLFTPKEVLSVTSANKLETYEEGIDWVMEDNMLCLTPNSRIFCFDEGEITFAEARPGWSFPNADGTHSLFHEGHFFHDRQIAVTYRKMEEQATFAPTFCGDKLPRTMAKLRNQEDVMMVLYGDSISEGSNSSGGGRCVTTPFLPTWGKLLIEKLMRHYGSDIRMVNTAKGGMDSLWGIANAKERAADYKPDLAIIAFGMNDREEPKKFAENIRTIKNIILSQSPQTEFILCATTIPRPGIQFRDYYIHQAAYRDALQELKEDGTVIADFYEMQMYLMKRKRFIDITGNNVNHPNDFMVRCHGQLLAEMLI